MLILHDTDLIRLFFFVLISFLRSEMGIPPLWKLLSEVNNGEPAKVPLSQLKGKTVVVDVPIWLIEFLKGGPIETS